jgi:hypothetical protein
MLWAYVLTGSTQVAVMNAQMGGNLHSICDINTVE